tara:strand:+ start:3215 stop:3583 length:369 start_codon:yes stop_codon:yes gene_type:complete
MEEYDSIVNNVINSFKQRSDIGKQKYGTDLDRNDLNFLQWVQHYQEELMDGILYLEKMKVTFIQHQIKNENKHDDEDDIDKDNYINGNLQLEIEAYWKRRNGITINNQNEEIFSVLKNNLNI